MIKNHLKFAFRTLLRKPTFSLINIAGLTVGLVCIVFIGNWVYDELSYDRHYQYSSIYRIAVEAGTGEDRWHQAVTALPLGPTATEIFPEVLTMTRLDYNDAIVESRLNRYFEKQIVLTDPSFFDVFGYTLLQGDEATALSDPYSVVLTESLAQKYFGDEDPIGKILKLYMYDPDGMGADYEITGIISDPPNKSHFTYNILGSISTISAVREGAMEEWADNNFYTYIRLSDEADPAELEAKFPEIVETYMGEMIDEFDLHFRLYMQPITAIHLNSDLQYEIMNNGRSELVYIFATIGLLILILAIINYVNLTTAISLDRTREIGVRKVMGARKDQLVSQHLAETMILCMVSVLVAAVIVKGFEPLFTSLTGKAQLVFGWKATVFQLLLVALPLGLIAGYFPARFLAGLDLLRSLQGKTDADPRIQLRSVLVTFQFAVTMVILIGVIVIGQQLSFIQSRDLGYNSENLMLMRVNGNEEVKNGYEPFKQELLANSGIYHVTRSGSMIADGLGNSNARVVHPDGDSQFEKLYMLSVGHDYLDTYGIDLVKGRNFDPLISSDSTEGFILNEKAVHILGWSAVDAIGKEMRFAGREGSVIGVVRDFHFNTLHFEIEPLCLFIRDNFSRITIKTSGTTGVNKIIATTWEKHFPSAIMDYTYQDQALLNTYLADQRFDIIFKIFSVISALIAFMGLFGAVGFTMQKRIKEIGIRKVLGATTKQILGHFSLKFLRTILFSAVIGFPIAWYSMKSWLDTFPYRIDLSLIHFGTALGIIIAIAVLIIVVQALQPSRTNPAQTLKSE